MSNEKISILIVDDEQELLEMYQEFFEMEGFQVTTASSAIDGMNIYKENQDINLIISDSHMKHMSGIDFLKKLKLTYQTIPAFYLTTGASEYTDEQIKSFGGRGLILKPFDLDEIIVRLKKDLNLNIV